jgi:hypothetical protein
MKKLMSILTAGLFLFALASCGGDKDSSSDSGSESSGSEASGSGSLGMNQSYKGNPVGFGWSEELMKECIDSQITEMKIDEEGMMEALLSFNPNLDLNTIAHCMCESAEKELPNIQSYSEIDEATEKDSTLEKEMMKTMYKCSEEFGEALENVVWESFYQDISYYNGESFAECIVSQAKEKYDIFGLMENGEKIVDEFMYDCEGLLPEM